MNIAFNINRLAMIGLGVTLDSLLKNCSDPKKLNIYILCADLSTFDKKNISKLLSRYGIINEYLIDFDAKKHFGNLKSLQGDWTAYGRLLLQDTILADTVLYLDADLVIEFDVLSIENFDFQDKAIAAVKGSELRDALESSFLINEIGLDPNISVFNSGIILFNMKVWREKNIKAQCLAFGENFPNKLLAADQTILNALFAGNFAHLPEEFNVHWYAHVSRPIRKKAILHFVGSPKPWDLFGRYFHKGFAVWRSYLDIEWKKIYYKSTYNDFLRAWEIRRSYARVLIRRIKSNFC
jgi:lipopolysaccharide biosynthesis glycosyltransferase